MKKNIKYIVNVALILGLAALALWFVMKDSEVSIILQNLRQARKIWLIPAVIMLVFYVCSESGIMRYLFYCFKEKIAFRKCLMLSNVGFFFGTITPGASGGQPMQVFYMTRCGVDTLVGTLVVMIITACFKFVLLLLCLVFLCIRPETMMSAISEVPILFTYGVVCTVAFLSFLLLCIYKSKTANAILSALINFGAKLRLIKNPEALHEKAAESIRNYEQAAIRIQQRPIALLTIVLVTLFQRLCFFSITFFTMCALKPGISWADVIATQIVLAFAVDILPLPGASGASEGVSVILFERFLINEELILSGMLLNRGITYYLLMLLTGIVTLFAHFYFIKTWKKIKERRTKRAGRKTENA